MRNSAFGFWPFIIALFFLGCSAENNPNSDSNTDDSPSGDSSDILKSVCIEWGANKDYVQSKMAGFDLIEDKGDFIKFKQKASKDFISYSFENEALVSSVALIHYKNGELQKPDFSDYRFLGGIPYFENGETAIHEVYSNLDDETLMVFYSEFPHMDYYCAVGFAPNMQTTDDYALQVNTGKIEEKGTNKATIALSSQNERVKECTRGVAYWYYTFMKDSTPLTLTPSTSHSYSLSNDGICVNLVNLDDDVRYSFCEFVAINGVVFWGNEKDFFTQKMSSGSVGTHDWVDLGLPSGTKWARCNVKATCPENNGYYYSWGDVKGIDHYPSQSESSWSSYRFYSNGLTKYIISNSADIASGASIDNKTELDLQDDVAYQEWGSRWRIPTGTQIKELVDECRWEMGCRAGIEGVYVYGKNGGFENNYIFLPVNSKKTHQLYYWSRSLDVSSYGDKALGLYSTGNFAYIFLDDILRRAPLNIRPVLSENTPSS